MKSSLVVLAAASLISHATAQFQGFVFMNTDCPKGNQDEHTENLDFTGNICFKQSYGSDAYKAKLSVLNNGIDNKSPTKFGGCPTSSCDQDCQTVDIESSGNQLTVDCADVSDGPYIYIGS